jgi:gamma-carbonic anhydrase
VAIVMPVGGKAPVLERAAFVAPNATIIGDVELGDEASIWFGAVVRGDIGPIRVGARTNLQDLVCVHVTGGVSVTTIGAEVTVGHGAILHGCTVADRCLIGMGSILLDNCTIGEDSIVGAGALVPVGKVIPPRSLVFGSPARVVREVTREELEQTRFGVLHYVENAKRFAAATRGDGG